jgi:hypothetical protein
MQNRFTAENAKTRRAGPDGHPEVVEHLGLDLVPERLEVQDLQGTSC